MAGGEGNYNRPPPLISDSLVGGADLAPFMLDIHAVLLSLLNVGCISVAVTTATTTSLNQQPSDTHQGDEQKLLQEEASAEIQRETQPQTPATRPCRHRSANKKRDSSLADVLRQSGDVAAVVFLARILSFTQQEYDISPFAMRGGDIINGSSSVSARNYHHNFGVNQSFLSSYSSTTALSVRCDARYSFSRVVLPTGRMQASRREGRKEARHPRTEHTALTHETEHHVQSSWYYWGDGAIYLNQRRAEDVARYQSQRSRFQVGRDQVFKMDLNNLFWETCLSEHFHADVWTVLQQNKLKEKMNKPDQQKKNSKTPSSIATAAPEIPAPMNPTCLSALQSNLDFQRSWFFAAGFLGNLTGFLRGIQRQQEKPAAKTGGSSRTTFSSSSTSPSSFSSAQLLVQEFFCEGRTWEELWVKGFFLDGLVFGGHLDLIKVYLQILHEFDAVEGKQRKQQGKPRSERKNNKGDDNSDVKRDDTPLPASSSAIHHQELGRTSREISSRIKANCSNGGTFFNFFHLAALGGHVSVLRYLARNFATGQLSGIEFDDVCSASGQGSSHHHTHWSQYPVLTMEEIAVRCGFPEVVEFLAQELIHQGYWTVSSTAISSTTTTTTAGGAGNPTSGSAATTTTTNDDDYPEVDEDDASPLPHFEPQHRRKGMQSSISGEKMEGGSLAFGPLEDRVLYALKYCGCASFGGSGDYEEFNDGAGHEMTGPFHVAAAGRATLHEFDSQEEVLINQQKTERVVGLHRMLKVILKSHAFLTGGLSAGGEKVDFTSGSGDFLSSLKNLRFTSQSGGVGARHLGSMLHALTMRRFSQDVGPKDFPRSFQALWELGKETGGEEESHHLGKELVKSWSTIPNSEGHCAIHFWSLEGDCTYSKSSRKRPSTSGVDNYNIPLFGYLETLMPRLQKQSTSSSLQSRTDTNSTSGGGSSSGGGVQFLLPAPWSDSDTCYPVNLKTENGGTPLIWAASAGSIGAILLLLNYGAVVSYTDEDGYTAIDWLQHFIENDPECVGENHGDDDNSDIPWYWYTDEEPGVKTMMIRHDSVDPQSIFEVKGARATVHTPAAADTSNGQINTSASTTTTAGGKRNRQHLRRELTSDPEDEEDKRREREMFSLDYWKNQVKRREDREERKKKKKASRKTASKKEDAAVGEEADQEEATVGEEETVNPLSQQYNKKHSLLEAIVAIMEERYFFEKDTGLPVHSLELQEKVFEEAKRKPWLKVGSFGKREIRQQIPISELQSYDDYNSWSMPSSEKNTVTFAGPTEYYDSFIYRPTTTTAAEFSSREITNTGTKSDTIAASVGSGHGPLPFTDKLAWHWETLS